MLLHLGHQCFRVAGVLNLNPFRTCNDRRRLAQLLHDSLVIIKVKPIGGDQQIDFRFHMSPTKQHKGQNRRGDAGNCLISLAFRR
jgi:hypothetical protein